MGKDIADDITPEARRNLKRYVDRMSKDDHYPEMIPGKFIDHTDGTSTFVPDGKDDHKLDEVIFGIAGWADKRMLRNNKPYAPLEAKAAIEAWKDAAVAEARIDELLIHGKFAMPDKPSDFYNQKLINERLVYLQALTTKDTDLGSSHIPTTPTAQGHEADNLRLKAHEAVDAYLNAGGTEFVIMSRDDHDRAWAEFINEAIIFSGKHVGHWDDNLSDGVRNGTVTKLLLDIPALREAVNGLIPPPPLGKKYPADKPSSSPKDNQEATDE